MIRFYWIVLLATVFCTLNAQTSEERAAVLRPVNILFDAMRAGDSASIRQVFTKDAVLKTVITHPDGTTNLRSTQLEDFLRSVGTPHDAIFDERIWNYDLRLDGNLASVWTEYSFFIGEQLSHCGVNAFQLIRNQKEWIIFHITDTRRRSDCRTVTPDVVAEIDTLLDRWHRAAATADEDVFFGSMTPDGVYLGTDPTERWLRDEMAEWAALTHFQAFAAGVM